MNFIYIDFEFNDTTEEILNLVCVSFSNNKDHKDIWLHKDKLAKSKLTKYLLHHKDSIFVAYGVVAEARSFYSLGLNPLDFKWIDLMLEYRHITNHNDALMYGNQLVNGVIKKTKRPPPKWERTEDDNKKSFKPTHSLAEASYKLLNVIRDTTHKTKMRDLIISAPSTFSNTERQKIVEYCKEDVRDLPSLFSSMLGHNKTLLGRKFKLNQCLKEMQLRGRYAALTAIREAKGYPIDFEKTKCFANNVPSIIETCQRDINRQFPDIKPFRYDVKKSKYTWNQSKTREWIEETQDTAKWLKTDKKALSLSLDAWTKVFNYSHDYPRGNFGAQMVRFLKLRQSLNGFTPAIDSKRKSFWDYVGRDKQVRPYMNIFGSQTSRSQPAASGFMFLKPAWQRSLVMPPKGYAITGIDYGSQEYFVSALLSKDKRMIAAYLGGDVYMDYAIGAKIAPKGATKATHKKERDLAKPVVLGISYDISKYGLATQLSQRTGKEVSPEKAQIYIDKFYERYNAFADFKEQLLESYYRDGYLRLKDGWTLWGDNDNHRSIGNFPVQGASACIMRDADLMAAEKGVNVIFTLHDALYILHKSDDLSAIDSAMDCMRRGFANYFPTNQQEIAMQVRLDCETWSRDYKAGDTAFTPKGTKIVLENIHIDPRAVNEYNKFSKYFYQEVDPIFN